PLGRWSVWRGRPRPRRVSASPDLEWRANENFGTGILADSEIAWLFLPFGGRGSPPHTDPAHTHPLHTRPAPPLPTRGQPTNGSRGSPTTIDILPTFSPTQPLPDSAGCTRTSPLDSHPSAAHDRTILLPTPDLKCEAVG